MKKVVIIDYGCGNLHSILKACEESAISKNHQIILTDNYKDLQNADHIILPGVGSFIHCMEGLKNIDGILEELKISVIDKKTNFLGVCVGMQLLADFGFEDEKSKGMGWIKGEVIPIEKLDNIRIPHMGWNNIDIISDHPIFKDIANNSDFYFVHSYHFVCENKNNIIATVDYANKLNAAIANDNIIATQFHPEKSQKNGLKLISNFLDL